MLTTTTPTTTIQSIAELASKLHQDKILQLLNSLDNADLIVLRDGQRLTIRNFSRSIALTQGPSDLLSGRPCHSCGLRLHAGSAFPGSVRGRLGNRFLGQGYPLAPL